MSGDPQALAEVAWLEDAVKTPPPVDELVELYRTFVTEGHFVMLAYRDRDDPHVGWFAWCAVCKDTIWGRPGDTWGTEALAGDTTRTLGDSGLEPVWYHEAKWWARNHRAGHGLEWQEWMPFMALDRPG